MTRNILGLSSPGCATHWQPVPSLAHRAVNQKTLSRNAAAMAKTKQCTKARRTTRSAYNKNYVPAWRYPKGKSRTRQISHKIRGQGLGREGGTGDCVGGGKVRPLGGVASREIVPSCVRVRAADSKVQV